MKYFTSLIMFMYLAGCSANSDPWEPYPGETYSTETYDSTDMYGSTDTYGSTDMYGNGEEGCGPNGTIRKNFEMVVENQLGNYQTSFIQELQPVIDASKKLTQEEQQTLLLAIIAENATPEGMRAILDGFRSIIQGTIIQGKSLGSTIIEDPLPFKNYAMTFKEYVVGGFERLLSSPIRTERLVTFAKVVIEAGNAKYAKLRTIMDALKETEQCGYFTNSCPRANNGWLTSLKSAVEHKCIDYSSVGYYGKYMGKAMHFMEQASHYVNLY